MKLSLAKSLAIFLTLLALTFSSIGVTPAYADWIFANKTTANGLGSNHVHGVFASGNTVYAATQGGLSISTNGGSTFTNKTTANGLGSNNVYGVFASGSTVYAATFNGLSISTNGGSTFANRTTANGLGSKYVYGVFASGSTVYAATWGGTTGGLSISTNGGNSFINKTTANGLGSNYVYGVFASGSRVYSATNSGLSISTNGGSSFTNKTIANGLGNNYVDGVFASGSTVYAATYGGLSISTNGGNSFANKTTANGLGDNYVHGVFASGSTVYAATWGGLSIGNNTLVFKSAGAQDGWILESTENSNIGGTLNATATTFVLGDNAQDKQYRAILHFNTSSLPDTAVVTKVTLKIKKQGLVGTDPFTVFGGLRVDMRKPFFGTTVGLVIGDFQATAGKSTVATFSVTPVSNWYSAVLNATGRAYINLTGTTQFRLRFATDDNNNNVADYMKFFSGNYATASARPTLIIQYYVP